MGPPPDSSVDLQLEIDRLCRAHGKEAVRAAVGRSPGRRAGRKTAPDSAFLYSVAIADADAWLVGRWPDARPTNYAIAKIRSAQEPEHRRDAVERRIELKLAEHRESFMLLVAAERAKNYGDKLVALETLSQLPEGRLRLSTLAKAAVQSYAALGADGLKRPQSDANPAVQQPVHRGIGSKRA